MSKFKLRQPQQGFSLLEVMVAILMMTGFLLSSLQLMVYAALLRVEGKEESEAIMWIREDSDYIRYLGSQLSCAAPGGSYGQPLLAAIVANDSTITSDTQTSAQPKSLSNSSSGRQYTLKRIQSNTGDDPNVVKLTYGVDYNGDGKTCDPSNNSTWDNCVVTNHVEIIPDVVFNCP
jgi:prepilin-type N-terminal cleavage/methylation domain-containing protein